MTTNPAATANSETTMRLRTMPNVWLVRVADPNGKLHEVLRPGALLPVWALWSDEQVRHLLDHGLCELVDDKGRQADPGRVWECVSALITLNVPEDAGAPRARDALRSKGFRYSNATICEAVRIRKSDEKYQPPAD